MTVIFDNLRNNDASPAAYTGVSIRLLTSVGGTPPGLVSVSPPSDSSSVIPAPSLHVESDKLGYWSADLVPNSLITPANTVYEVKEGGADPFYISVPPPANVTLLNPSGDKVWCGSILSVYPGSLPPSPLVVGPQGPPGLSGPPGPGAMPYYVPAGTMWVVEQYTQGLFAVPILIEGTLDIEGIIVEVD